MNKQNVIFVCKLFSNPTCREISFSKSCVFYFRYNIWRVKIYISKPKTLWYFNSKINMWKKELIQNPTPCVFWVWIWRVVYFSNTKSDALLFYFGIWRGFFSYQNLTRCKIFSQNLMRSFSISISEAMCSFQPKIWGVVKSFLKIIVLRKARKKQSMSFSWSKRRKRDFLYAHFLEIRHAEKCQSQHLKRFFFQYNIWLVKEFSFENLMRCIFPSQNLTCSKSFNWKPNAFSFFFNQNLTR